MANPGYQLERFGLLIVWLAVIALFGMLRPGTFLTWSNFSSIFGSEAVLVIVTLGLITFVINALMLWLTSAICAHFAVQFHVKNFISALVGSLIITAVSLLLHAVLPDDKKK